MCCGDINFCLSNRDAIFTVYYFVDNVFGIFDVYKLKFKKVVSELSNVMYYI